MAPRVRSSPRGFTLIELLVGLAVFSIVAAALETLILGTVHANGAASHVTAASTLAEDKLEELRQTPYAALASGADGVLLTPARAPGGIFTRSWTVTSNSPTAKTKTIAVTVQWTDKGSRQVDLRTIVYEPPPPS